MRWWGDARTISATAIRDILRGRLVADPDPHGLRLRGARISGRLDLEDLTTDVNLELKDCLLEEGVLARGAHLAGVSLAGCQIEHTIEPSLDAERLTCNVLILSGARITGHAKEGAVRLVGAHIGIQLNLSGALLVDTTGPALIADSLQVDLVMLLRDKFTAIGHGPNGAVPLVGAHIGGQLECDGAELTNNSGPALAADSLQVGQPMYLRGGFTATGHGPSGAVRLYCAHIGAQLDCTGRACATTPAPPWSPTACKSARTWA
jgi:hypothetical protein